MTGAVRGACRCHPQIAAISNSQFYGGRLLDGCSAGDRAPLVRGLPPLLCLDVCGSEEYAAGSHSACNRTEASAVAQVQPDSTPLLSTSACGYCSPVTSKFYLNVRGSGCVCHRWFVGSWDASTPVRVKSVGSGL